MWVGITQSTEGLNRTERQRKGKLALCLSWAVCLLLSLGISALESQAFGFGLELPTSFPGAPVC